MSLLDFLRNPGENNLLRYCPNCGSERAALSPDWTFCNADATENPDGEFIEFLVMCGECLMWRYVLPTVKDAERWEHEVLEPADRAIQRLIDTTDTARFKDWCATFIGSVHHDVLLPEDF